MKPLRVGIIGFGKIAADQHIPAIASNPRFELVGTSSRSGAGEQPVFADWRDLVTETAPDVVAITTPPGPRYEIARSCLEAGLHVLLEKPPTVTLSEIEDLACIAEANQRTLFATWHTRENEAVAAAAKALAGKRVAGMQIRWHEDVRKWHPEQAWIWEAGGFGVFDPGINAFSIVTRIFPGSLVVKSAALSFPEGAQTPIAADIQFASPDAEGALTCSLDWRRSEGEEWTIAVTTTGADDILLSDGGKILTINGEQQPSSGAGEYPHIYRRLLDLIDQRRSDVDVRPLRLVADCLLIGTRDQVELPPA